MNRTNDTTEWTSIWETTKWLIAAFAGVASVAISVTSIKWESLGPTFESRWWIGLGGAALVLGAAGVVLWFGCNVLTSRQFIGQLSTSRADSLTKVIEKLSQNHPTLLALPPFNSISTSSRPQDLQTITNQLRTLSDEYETALERFRARSDADGRKEVDSTQNKLRIHQDAIKQFEYLATYEMIAEAFQQFRRIAFVAAFVGFVGLVLSASATSGRNASHADEGIANLSRRMSALEQRVHPTSEDAEPLRFNTPTRVLVDLTAEVRDSLNRLFQSTYNDSLKSGTVTATAIGGDWLHPILILKSSSGKALAYQANGDGVVIEPEVPKP